MNSLSSPWKNNLDELLGRLSNRSVSRLSNSGIGNSNIPEDGAQWGCENVKYCIRPKEAGGMSKSQSLGLVYSQRIRIVIPPPERVAPTCVS